MKKKLLRLLQMVSYYTFIGITMQVLFINLIFADNSHAQKVKNINEVRLELDLNDASLIQAFEVIESKTNFKFTVERKDLDPAIRINFNGDASLKEVLLNISKEASLKFRQINYHIDVRKLKGKNGKNEIDRVEVITQTRTISGTVSSQDDEEGLPGVNVVEFGTTNGTITDVNGSYSLEVAEGSTLVFSSVGFVTKEIPTGSRSVIDVKLEIDIAQLEEVVVVGYGTQKKANVLGAVSSVSSEDLANQNITSGAQALSGRVAGVQLIQGSAQPGRDNPVLSIRGVNTIRSNADQQMSDTAPLVIVDGVQSTFNDIHPQDIESISILKDASSAAIYGARAANGVILITTKRGKIAKPSISYNASYGWQNATFIPEMLNPLEFGILKNESRTNVGRPPLYSQEDLDWFASSQHDSWAEFAYIENAPIINHHLSISGGTEAVRYTVSVGLQDQEGVVLNTSSTRYNIRSNIDVKISDQIRAGLNLSGSLTNVSQSSSGPQFLVRNVLRHPPIALVDGLIKPDGFYSRGTAGRHSHGGVTIAEHEIGGMSNEKLYRFTPSLYFEYEPVQNLVLRINGSQWVENSRNSNFRNPFFTSDGENLFPSNGIGTLTEQYYLNITNLVETTANYSKLFGRSQLTALAGFSDQTFEGEDVNSRIQGFSPDGLQRLSAGTLNPSVSGGGNEWALRSVFGRLGYKFDDRYLAEFNVRYDGSSRFGPQNRWGVFPSFSLGWRVSEESFMQNLSWLNELKLRANWGQLGNQNIGDYRHIATVSIAQPYILGNSVAPGAAVTSLANPNIKWETQTQTNVGLDISIVNSRLNFVIDYYDKVTDDILLFPPVPRTLGNLAPPAQNQGKVQNRGIEFLVNYFGDIGNDFEYSISANFSHNNNEVLELNETMIGNKNITQVGDPINSYYGHRILGIFNSDQEAQNAETWGIQPGGVNHSAGDYIYADENGDGVINADDRIIIGDPNIRNTLGATITMNYKGFDFRTLFQGVIGRDIEDGIFGNDGMRVLHNAQKKFLNRWTPENQDTNIPRVAEGVNWNSSQWFGPLNSFHVLDASYVRMKHIELGYTFPVALIEKAGLSKVRLYVSGQNLLTFTSYKDGFDPEDEFLFNNVGDDYPNAKTIAAGINLSF